MKNVGVLISKDIEPFMLFQKELNNLDSEKTDEEKIITVVISNHPHPELNKMSNKTFQYYEVYRKDYSSRIDHEKAFLNILEPFKISILILIDYDRILSPLCIKNTKFRILNLHSSLLPAFRGIYPERQALEYGAKVTGLTTHLLKEDIDKYEIIQQIPVLIDERDDEKILKRKIDRYKGKIIISSLQKLI